MRHLTRCLFSLPLIFLAFGTANAQNGLTEVITIKVRPGMDQQFEETMRARIKAARQQGSKTYWRVAQSVTGAPTYTVSVAMSGWADLGTPGVQLEKALGKDEAMRIGELAAASVESVDRAFYMPQVDMSNPPAEGGAAPAVVQFFDLTLKPGMAQQYMEASRKTTVASKAVMPDSHYVTMMPGAGAGGAVRVVAIVQSWSDLDKPQMSPAQRVIKHFGQEEGGRIAAQAGDTISDVKFTVNRTRPDLSYQPQ